MAKAVCYMKGTVNIQMNSDEIVAYFNSLDRAQFLDETNRKYAKVDSPLPIGFGQTISQPSLVLEMTLLLMPEQDKTVLEIGTGSGFQTALLAGLSKHVFSIELVSELSDSARKRLGELGYGNISYKTGDGSLGWQENAPYDRIMVTAGAGDIPQKLIWQLAPGGIMIVPVGSRFSQQLLRITKSKRGKISTERKGGVVFVEFKGEYGYTKNDAPPD